jgi:hypothetical protein
MQTQKISFLYKFYCWGWRNASLRGFSLSQHWLLSIFLHYRRGFAEGSKWRQSQVEGSESQQNQMERLPLDYNLHLNTRT